MSLKVMSTAAFILIAAGIVLSPSAHAIDWDAWRAEREAVRAERAAQREAARAQRDAEREARRAEREAEREEPSEEKNEDEDEEARCDCRASLSFNRPSLHFSNGTLQFKPTVDINIRSRGDSISQDFDWRAQLNWNGNSSYESDDVELSPIFSSFGGSQTVFAGACGDDFRFRGYQLPPVGLTGITSTLVGNNQELEGMVELDATLSGCGEDENEHRQFTFSLEDFTDLRVGGWRTVR